jgi:hypothetical protein
MKLYHLFFITLLVSLVFPNELFGQTQKQDSRFTIGAFYNPSENTYTIYGKTNYGSDAIVKSHTGHNYGILSSYKLTKILNIQSGVGLSDFGYEMEYSGPYYPKGLYRYNVGYVEVPLEFRMIVTSPTKRLKLIGAIGGFIAFLTKNKGGNPEYLSGTTQIDLKNLDNFDLYAPILGGLNIGAALSYSYSDKINFEFQPTIKVFFNRNTYSYVSGVNEWTHISSTGFRLSINYKL